MSPGSKSKGIVPGDGTDVLEVSCFNTSKSDGFIYLNSNSASTLSIFLNDSGVSLNISSKLILLFPANAPTYIGLPWYLLFQSAIFTPPKLP